MSNHTSSSQPNLINRAYVLVPPPLKRKSSHLDRTLSPIDPSEPKTTFAPKKRQKLTVDIKLKNFDKSRYSSFNGNLYVQLPTFMVYCWSRWLTKCLSRSHLEDFRLQCLTGDANTVHYPYHPLCLNLTHFDRSHLFSLLHCQASTRIAL
ncbi:hypothetical protein BJ165DRAFT_807626 [Panaeolus papilionaceus]|nr:hypothetical protein BJ165DRAFT_807626 [Panaeolus papilionaceus]